MKVGDYVKVTDVELKTKFPHAYKINNLSNNYVEIKIDGIVFHGKNGEMIKIKKSDFGFNR